jgi:hypothetical protein
MNYKVVPFDPAVGRSDPASVVAAALEALIAREAAAGWQFVSMENHYTVVPGSNGCFGIGQKQPFTYTYSSVVFRR